MKKANTTKPGRKTNRRQTENLSAIDKLIALKAKQEKIEAEMKKAKETVHKLLKNSEKNSIQTPKGKVTLVTVNSWSLPPINAAKAQGLLGESFTFYFKEKLSYGVEQLAKNKIGDPEDELGNKLKELVEIEAKESWKIEVA